MVNIVFKHFPGDDLDDFIQKVGKSFNITFEPFELANVNTLHELRDHLVIKMKDKLTSGCTTQQAYYKLKSAINEVTGITAVTPQTLLADVIPLKNRRQTVNNIEKALGFRINILKPKSWIESTLAILVFASLITFFFNWKIALAGLLASVAGFYIANYFGKEFRMQTLREAAEQITFLNYSKVRSLKGTITEGEIEKVLLELFLDTLPYTENELAQDFAT